MTQFLCLSLSSSVMAEAKVKVPRMEEEEEEEEEEGSLSTSNESMSVGTTRCSVVLPPSARPSIGNKHHLPPPPLYPPCYLSF